MASNSDGGRDDLMGRGDADERPPEGAAKRGLSRLMLKLPSVRGTLHSLGMKSEALESLCEAYEDASVTLDRLLHSPADGDGPMVDEYRTICAEIEADVIRYCLEKDRRVP